jgi:hypothetical protein
MNDKAFQEFVDEAADYLKARVAIAQETFGIGDFERYDCDLSTVGFGGLTTASRRLKRSSL